MKITKVSTEQYYRGIPLKGWGSVDSALNMFARGVTKGSRVTEDHQLNAVGASQGLMGLAFYLTAAPHMEGAGNEFVKRMLDEAEPIVEARGHWRASYDYDGMGVFFKTGVEIKRLSVKNDLYLLEIWAAYVGDEPEIGLAEALGVPRTMLSSTVTIQVEPQDDKHFAFDFEQVLRKLDGVLSTKRLQGTIVARHFMTGDRYSSAKSLPIHSKDGFNVSINTGRVESRFVYDDHGSRNPLDTWKVDGAVLYGLLDTSYEDKTKKDPPTFTVSIRSAESFHYDESKPIWEPERKKMVMDLTNRIAQALA